VLFLVFGSLLVGYFYERLDRRVIMILSGLVILAMIGWMYFRRFL
jgi:predicted MFS family arabinose efflux permease